ncbi:MAG: Do family serine endopeptidase [Nitrospirales bacterium]|nr:Do family serine endopeptidase [Nitrospira sp.]MDR4502708.1 Do family serine endopeptidase [Nitrospirales bacterium]
MKHQIEIFTLSVFIVIFISMFGLRDRAFASENLQPVHPLPSAQHDTKASALSQELIRVAAQAKPSVVGVLVKIKPQHMTKPSMFPFFLQNSTSAAQDEEELSPDEEERGNGAGVIIDPEGYIITNNHVVDGAYDIRIQLDSQEIIPATIVGSDPTTDLALLKTSMRKLPALRWGDSTRLQVGEIVVAIGNPFGLTQTVTMGIVSAIGRDTIGVSDYEDFIQTDAAINPGNSGGALLNLRGELVGINTAIFTENGGAAGIGFAVPSQIAKTISILLRQQGKVIRGWMGIAVQKLSPDLARWFKVSDHHGVIVTDLAADGPAEQANLKKGDIIQGLNGIKISSPHQLHALVAQSPPGTTIFISRIRNGELREVRVKMIERQSSSPETVEIQKILPHQNILSDIEVEPLPSDLAKDRKGVLVSEIPLGSPADISGLEEGDIVVEVNQGAIESVEDFDKVRRAHKNLEQVLMLIRREDTNMFLIVGPTPHQKTISGLDKQ